MLSVGTQAPDFTLPDQNGELKSLADYKGQKVILRDRQSNRSDLRHKPARADYAP